MNSPQLTLLMPMYNADEFVEQTLKSLKNQTFQDWKLIIINDGSTDGSAQICHKYAESDSRVHLIDQENCGVSETRNRLLQHIDTPYFSFIDADDELHPTLYQVLMSHMLTQGVDLVMCGYKEQKRSHETVIQEIERTFKSGILQLDQMQNTFMEFANTLTINPLWNKVYKTEILRELEVIFPRLETGEDIVFNLNYLKGCQKIYMEEKTLYSYVHRQKESITTSYVERMYEKGVEIHEQLEQFLRQMEYDTKENKLILMENHLGGVFSAWLNLYHKDCTLKYKDKKQEIEKILSRDYVQSCAQEVQTSNKLIQLVKILIKFNSVVLINLCFKLIALLRNFKKIWK